MVARSVSAAGTRPGGHFTHTPLRRPAACPTPGLTPASCQGRASGCRPAGRVGLGLILAAAQPRSWWAFRSGHEWEHSLLSASLCPQTARSQSDTSEPQDIHFLFETSSTLSLGGAQGDTAYADPVGPSLPSQAQLCPVAPRCLASGPHSLPSVQFLPAAPGLS